LLLVFCSSFWLLRIFIFLGFAFPGSFAFSQPLLIAFQVFSGHFPCFWCCIGFWFLNDFQTLFSYFQIFCLPNCVSIFPQLFCLLLPFLLGLWSFLWLLLCFQLFSTFLLSNRNFGSFAFADGIWLSFLIGFQSFCNFFCITRWNLALFPARISNILWLLCISNGIWLSFWTFLILQCKSFTIRLTKTKQR